MLGAMAVDPAVACEPVHGLRRIPASTTVVPAQLCWTGPCRGQLREVDTLGRTFIHKDGDGVIDNITMLMTNGVLQQVLVAQSGNVVCGPPTGTVAGCSERYKLRVAKACPLGTAPCRSRDRIDVELTNLDDVNTLTTGGSITLADGQVVKGSRTNAFWLYYEVCCPDAGQFGLPGTSIAHSNTYTTRRGSDPATCEVKETRQTSPDVIPVATFPCP
jgi:hypothetical protein